MWTAVVTFAYYATRNGTGPRAIEPQVVYGVTLSEEPQVPGGVTVNDSSLVLPVIDNFTVFVATPFTFSTISQSVTVVTSHPQLAFTFEAPGCMENLSRSFYGQMFRTSSDDETEAEFFSMSVTPIPKVNTLAMENLTLPNVSTHEVGNHTHCGDGHTHCYSSGGAYFFIVFFLIIT